MQAFWQWTINLPGPAIRDVIRFGKTACPHPNHSIASPNVPSWTSPGFTIRGPTRSDFSLHLTLREMNSARLKSSQMERPAGPITKISSAKLASASVHCHQFMISTRIRSSTRVKLVLMTSKPLGTDAVRSIAQNRQIKNQANNNALHRSSVAPLRRFGDDRFAIVSSPNRLRSAPLPVERGRYPTEIPLT